MNVLICRSRDKMGEVHPCAGCVLFDEVFPGFTTCRAGLPKKRPDGNCYVKDRDEMREEEE